MKSTAKGKNESEYPKLMIIVNNDGVGTIVLFSSLREGVVVHPSGDYAIGHSSDSWLGERFEDFYGEVILSNN